MTPTPNMPIEVDAKAANKFWAKVEKTDFCWIWQAYRNEFGYGRHYMAGNPNRLAHRIAWQLHAGEIPQGMCVLHKCDNPACVNPSHLFLGTQQENIADMVKKGRGSKFQVRVRRLSDHQAMMAKSCPMTKGAATILAKEFGVSAHTILHIRSGKTWTHLPNPSLEDRSKSADIVRIASLAKLQPYLDK